MSDSLQYPVHEGIWTNWSNGRIFGATLTISNNNGTLLVAFVALFISLAGTQLWRIFCFAVHQICSSSTADGGDALYHQRQAILRNAAEPTGGAIKFLQLLTAWNHKSRAKRPFYRIAPLLVGALIVTCGLAAASGFSAKIVQGNEVLIDGQNCGFLDRTLANEIEKNLYIDPFSAEEQQVDSTYVQQCYSGSSISGSLGCNTFVQEQLPYTATKNASCPFADSICRSKDSNVFMDTGFLDSHADFGMNAPESERFKFRLTLHCAPLEWRNYTQIRNMPNNRSITQYFYGHSNLYDSNWTIQASNDLYKDEMSLHIMNSDYKVHSYSVAWSGDNTTDFSEIEPITELASPNVTLFMLFLKTNGVVYYTPVNDPWFQATTVVGKDLESNVSGYGADTPASPMGCYSRRQYCNAQGKCSPLDLYGGFPDAVREVFPEDYAHGQVAWFDMVAGLGSDLGPIVHGRNPLNVSIGLLTGVMGRPLADDHWKTEVAYWFSTMLASIQRKFVTTATGPRDGKLDPFMTRPVGEAEENSCYSQKILSSYHMSFSLFGLLFIFILGTIVIILGILLPTVVAFFQKRRNSNAYARLEWCTNDVLQLQRLAHEQLGLGTWIHATKSVPITQGDTMLGTLDISDLKHPYLRVPDAKENNIENARDLMTSSTSTKSETTIVDNSNKYTQHSVSIEAQAQYPALDDSPEHTSQK